MLFKILHYFRLQIFPQLLKLCSTQHPHLCLVQDWLEDEATSKDFSMGGSSASSSSSSVKDTKVSEAEVREAFAAMRTCPSKMTLVMRRMLTGLQPPELWRYSRLVVSHFPDILDSKTPRQIRGTLVH